MNGFLNKQPASAQLSTLIGFFIGFMFIYFAAAKLIIPPISGGYTLEELFTAVKKDSGLVPYLKLAQFLYTFIVFLLPAVIFLYLCYPHPLTDIGGTKAPSVYNLVFTVLIMASAIPFVSWLVEWNATWPLGKDLLDLEKNAEEQTQIMLTTTNIGGLLVNLLIAAVLPALAEELYFRAGMQRIIQTMTRNGFVAVFITSILFSAIHMQFLGFLPRFALSMLLGGIYLISGNFWLAVIAHFCNNALGVILFYFNPEEATDESYAWYISAISAVVVLALFGMMRRTNKITIPQTPQNDQYGERLD